MRDIFIKAFKLFTESSFMHDSLELKQTSINFMAKNAKISPKLSINELNKKNARRHTYYGNINLYRPTFATAFVIVLHNLQTN